MTLCTDSISLSTAFQVISDDICVRKDMRVWDKYIVTIVKNV